ncbi:uncharacterized protein LOC141849473 [Brevipalpus obovatus]|uniref:uncharacterized protein LOC141849473 n=1 Tax=Brevipalpus obovatus TaxID=246614 RepID=UPI003D9DC944
MSSINNYFSLLTVILFTIITLCSHLSNSSGVFEIKLKFTNELNVDQDGQCCDGSPTFGILGKCRVKCDTYIRVCLRHYEPVISQDGRCTLGEAIVKHDQIYDIARIPFNFTWPREFALILEAYYHDSKSDPYGPIRKTIIRLEKQHSVDNGIQWQRDVINEKQMSMEYDYRAICSSDSYGKGCAQTCISRNDTFGHWYCTDVGKKCHQGWTGDFCELPICAPGCKYGNCKKPGGCECHNGYEGKLCDQCIPRVGCVHGKCSKPYECVCEPGWGGLYCDRDMNYCSNHRPCKNGTCTNVGPGLYECKCHLGFTGVNCDVRIPNCSKSPCRNSATCKNISLSSSSTDNPSNHKGYSCECLPGTHGEHCEKIGSIISKNTCVIDPCHNGGTCTNTPSGYMCSCRVGYGGANCQIKKTTCDQNPCLNDAECIPNPFSRANPSFRRYQCSCKPGFTGEHCEIIINDCQPNSCRNGGTCIDGPETFMCICPRGITGQYCDLAVVSPPLHSSPSDPFFSEQLSFSRLVLISVASIIIPMVAVMAAAIVFAFQKRRVRSQERQWFENEEAIRQNEENSAKKRLSNGTYVIVNNLDRDKSSVSSSPSVNNVVDCGGGGPNNYETIKNSQNNLYQHIDGGGGGGVGGGGGLVGPVLPGRLTVGLTVGLPPPSSDLRKSTPSLFRTKKTISRTDESNLTSHTNNFRNSVHNINTANYNNNLTVRTVNISSLMNAATIKDQLNRI